MLSSLLALLFVFGLLGGALFLLRRWGQPSAKGQHLEVVETVALGPGKSLSLVAVGNKSFLLAATNDRISLVSELQASDLKIEVDLLANEPDTIAGFKAAGFKTAGFKTAGFKTAGFNIAALNAAAKGSRGARMPAGYLRSFRAVLSRRLQRHSDSRVATGRT